MKTNPSDNLANERTFLAYIRTALAMIGFGFVIARFGLALRVLAAAKTGGTASAPASTDFGLVMVGAGVAIAVFGLSRYDTVARALATGSPTALSSRGATLFVLLLTGFAITVGYILYNSGF
jgi:putative membrane protein